MRTLGATGAVLGGGAGLIYALFIGVPVIALLVKSAEQGGLLESLSGDFAVTALKLSLITSAIAMVLVILVGTPFAYLLARSDSLLLRLVDSLVELPIVLPPVVAGVAMLMTFGRQGILGPHLAGLGINLPFTAAAVVCAQIFVAAPFFVRSAKIGFQSVAQEYEDISQTLGASPISTFLRLTLPLAGPSMIAGLALAWARAISEFGATMMFAGNLTGKTQTLPLAIMTALQSDLTEALALSVLLMAGAVLVLVALGLATRRHWQGRV
ncbi:MAG: molybdenum ABC transporter permease subunit [SAR202 cluster bacterium Io17-Chloro-G9]|nr:MAG: molybdenum ABC transporter permease subunit [SAR202 cluster bacterium Io17-Chloro-G9]